MSFIVFYNYFHFSEDPICSSQETFRSNPVDAGTEVTEDENGVISRVCECSNCPDLSKEDFSRCCKSVKQAREHCLKMNITCICQSPKLQKFFDKASVFSLLYSNWTFNNIQDVLELLLFVYYDTLRFGYNDPPENRYN